MSYTPAASFAGTDSFTYRTSSSAGVSPTATVTINVAEPTDVQAPQELRVSSIVGNARDLPLEGAVGRTDPTGFILEGGVAPGQTLVALPTGSAAPIFTWRLRTARSSSASRHRSRRTERHVERNAAARQGVPVPPSAPPGLQATVSGSSLHLAWTPTFAGAAASGAMLDVTGTLAARCRWRRRARLAAGVPPGTYTMRLRSVNAGGSSVATAPVTITAGHLRGST